MTIGQTATETGWGRHVPDNAYFGIKGKAVDGSTANHTTHETINGKEIKINQDFRAYKDFAEAADGYGEFLNVNPRFRAAFLHTDDPVRFVQEVAKAGYATGHPQGPSYFEVVTSIIKTHNLAQYDK